MYTLTGNGRENILEAKINEYVCYCLDVNFVGFLHILLLPQDDVSCVCVSALSLLNKHKNTDHTSAVSVFLCTALSF